MQKYDLAVIGAGLGGLAAAALAATQNKRVIVLDPATSPGGSWAVFKKNKYNFFGPDLSFGFERGDVIQQIMESLGITQRASVRSPCYQAALPGKRITVYAEQGETLDELRREFADEIESILRFYRDVQKLAARRTRGGIAAYLLKHKTARGFLRGYRFSPEFKCFLDLQSQFFFDQPASTLPLASLVTMCDSAPSTVHGGFGSVAEQMVDSLLKHGGEIKYGIPFDGITIETGRPSRLSIAQTIIMECDYILFNVDPVPVNSRMYMAIREEVVPVTMLQHVLYMNDYSRPDYFYSLSLSAKDDEAAAPRGMRALSVAYSPAVQRLSGEERTRQVGSLLPFLEDFLIFQEDYNPELRLWRSPEPVVLKSPEANDKRKMVRKTSSKGIFTLYEGYGTPAQAFAAARFFTDRML